MARFVIQDYLQAYPFHLMDVAPVAGIPLLTPLSCFSSITAPTITLETKTITEGNNPYKTRVVQRADVGSMVLTRGVSAFNSDFYRWIQTAVQGSTSISFTSAVSMDVNAALGGPIQNGGPTYRRNMLLIHFFARNPLLNGIAGQVVGGSAVLAAAAMEGGAQAAITVGAELGMTVAGNNTSDSKLGQAARTVFGGNVIRVPARAFLLKGCIPTRYKSGTDFDASSSEVSIQELEIQPQSWDELSLF